MATAETENELDADTRLLHRRRSSQQDHINRIRTAYLRKQASISGKNVESQEHLQRDSLNILGKKCSSKFHSACLVNESAAELDNVQHNAAGNFQSTSLFPRHQRLSVDSAMDRLDSLSLSKFNTLTSRTLNDDSNSRYFGGNETDNSEEIHNTEERETNNAQREEERNITRKLLAQNKETTSKISNKLLPLTQSNLKNHQISLKNSGIQNHSAIQGKELMPSQKSSSGRDVVILKWLHDVHCPEEEKSGDKSQIRKFPVRILKVAKERTKRKSFSKKSTLKTPIDKATNRGSQIKNGKRTRRAIKKKIIHKEKAKGKNTLNSETTKEVKKTGSTSSLNPPLDSKSDIQQKSAFSANSSSKEVELYISELGKLQIVLDLRSLSPEDAAIVVWLDDLPKSGNHFTELKESSEVASLTNPKNEIKQEISSSIQQSSSFLNLEDSPTPRPNIYFPPVTILKNVLIGSPSELEDSKKDFESAIFYKRCNLNHTEPANVVLSV